jgi:medium-chain acyl-[acyl-carrier-protein] hydrolase
MRHEKYLKTISKTDSKLALIYFPFAGAGAFSVYKFAQILAPICRTIGVQLPGREDRLNDPPPKNHLEIYQALEKALGAYSDCKLIFWGHSLGAFLAFETASYLEKLGLKGPELLIISGANSPPDEVKNRMPLHHLNDQDFVAKFISWGGLPPDIKEDKDFQEFFLPALRNDIFLLDTYRYTPNSKVSGEILAFTGEEDKEVKWDFVKNWELMTKSNFNYHVLPGNHFFINDPKSGFPSLLFQTIRKLSQN